MVTEFSQDGIEKAYYDLRMKGMDSEEAVVAVADAIENEIREYDLLSSMADDLYGLLEWWTDVDDDYLDEVMMG